ncbi:rhodanese-like domain-containing protein [Schaalia sp. Marseille-Q2122]|uniref:rhodanese-like domain-containing protein n=1 Tax=Schaalia sp. Marseille-Q2122 TaxID=2736604 RepID=UPI00158977E7|nr:rhodanese-like domain-containing protein [Schaalia sp. Marseille-Q2122]
MMNLRRPGLLTLCCTLAIGASACSSTPAANTAEEAATTTTQSAVQDTPASDLTIIDVRTPEEYAEGHLEGAINIDIYAEDFERQIKALDPSGNYAVYCRSGNRSGQAVSFMEGAGFTTVQDLGSREAAAEALGAPIVK